MKKLAIILCSLLIHYACYADQIGLHNKHIDIRWVRTSEGWKITRLTHTGNGKKCSWGTPDGSYTILFSAEKPDQETPETILDRNKDTILFVEPHFKNVLRNLDRSLTEVPLNRAGMQYVFYPTEARQEGNSIISRVRVPWVRYRPSGGWMNAIPRIFVSGCGLSPDRPATIRFARPHLPRSPRHNFVGASCRDGFRDASSNRSSGWPTSTAKDCPRYRLYAVKVH